MQNLNVDAEVPLLIVNDLSLDQRYKINDPTKGPYGQSSGKFNFSVSYKAKRQPNLPILSAGWKNGDKEVHDYEPKKEEEKVPGNMPRQGHISGIDIPNFIEANNLTPLRVPDPFTRSHKRARPLDQGARPLSITSWDNPSNLRGTTPQLKEA